MTLCATRHVQQLHTPSPELVFRVQLGGVHRRKHGGRASGNAVECRYRNGPNAFRVNSADAYGNKYLTQSPFVAMPTRRFSMGTSLLGEYTSRTCVPCSTRGTARPFHTPAHHRLPRILRLRLRSHVAFSKSKSVGAFRCECHGRHAAATP